MIYPITDKDISSECKFKFDDRKYNSNQKWNNDKCWGEYKNPKGHNACENIVVKMADV